ncbi:DciA family protein [Asticcacaulis sp. BYS171W]|uniref:DciA family protein n=1 Tax=Asticcacaulis aquaticus TaxID=2984212 RepID=A0ABT5HUP7_9CAUL|nr:DciA family protein [Asticcacaulis aquaticus]MDC7683802.1 DciA family protein [Asticcacaulis aquaticus]
MKDNLPSLDEAVRILRTTRTRRAPKPPPPVNRQIAPLLKTLNERFEAYDTGAGRLKNRWAEIVGDTVARITEPLKVVRGKPGSKTPGTLELRVEGAYAAVIQHQNRVIIDRVNLFLGAGTVERLRLVQGPIQRAAKAAPPPPKRPLSAIEDLGLQESLKDVTDDRLKRELLKLGRAVLLKDKNTK